MTLKQLQFLFYIRADFFPDFFFDDEDDQKNQCPLLVRETQFVHLKDDRTEK